MKDRKKTYSRASLAALAFMTIAMPVLAQGSIREDGPRFSFKAGIAPVIGDVGNQQRRESAMVSLEYSHPFWKGEFFVAAEFRDFVSHAYEVTPFSPFVDRGGEPVSYTERTGYASNGSRGYITAYARRSNSSPDPWMLWPDMRFDSVDMRTNPLDGGTAKIAYRYRTRSLPVVGSLGLQGGITLSLLTSIQYADGAIHVMDYRDESQNSVSTATYPYPNSPGLDQFGRLDNEYYYLTNKDAKLMPGVFIGARKLLNDNLTFEVNFTMLGHTDLNYVPYSYTGQTAHWESSDKSKVLMEFIVGLRF